MQRGRGAMSTMQRNFPSLIAVFKYQKKWELMSILYCVGLTTLPMNKIIPVVLS